MPLGIEPSIGIAGCKNVPVNHYVYAKLFAPIDNLVHLVGKTAIRGVPVFSDVHGSTKEVDAPIFGEKRDGFFRIAIVEPLKAVARHSHKLDALTRFVDEMHAVEREFSVSSGEASVVNCAGKRGRRGWCA